MDTFEFEILIQKVLDSSASPVELQQVRASLKESEEHRRIYCQHTRLEALLSQRTRGLRSLTASTPIIPLETLRQSQRKHNIRWITVNTIAAMLILSLCLNIIFIKPEDNSLTFQTSPETKYTLSHTSDHPIEGQSMRTGSSLQLHQGAIELTFVSGVKSIIEAPADITLEEDNKLALNEGKAWFHVPKSAIGFTVETPDMHIIDLGTEFAVLSTPAGNDQCHVFEGKVKVNAQYSLKQSTELTKGNAVSATPTGRLTTTPVNQDVFLSSLPTEKLHLHWSFDEIEDGMLKCESNYSNLAKTESHIVNANSHEQNSANGKFGQALKLPDHDSHVTTNWPGLPGNQPRTVSYWLKPAPSVSNEFHSTLGWGQRTYDSEKQDHFLLYTHIQEDGSHRLGVTTGSYHITVEQPLHTGQWHHISCVYHGKNTPQKKPHIEFYLNGILVQKTSDFRRENSELGIHTLTTTQLSTPFSIGSSLHLKPNLDFQRNTAIDELHIFGYALKPSEVEQLYLNNSLK